MPNENKPDHLGIAGRLERQRGRTIRDQVIGAKITSEEQDELTAVARREGKLLSEWMRDTLLREARTGRADMAVFTEAVALRRLMSTVLRSVAIGEKLTPEAYAQIITEVRAEKHDDACELMSQYQNRAGEQ